MTTADNTSKGLESLNRVLREIDNLKDELEDTKEALEIVLGAAETMAGIGAPAVRTRINNLNWQYAVIAVQEIKRSKK